MKDELEPRAQWRGRGGLRYNLTDNFFVYGGHKVNP